MVLLCMSPEEEHSSTQKLFYSLSKADERVYQLLGHYDIHNDNAQIWIASRESTSCQTGS